MTWPTVLGGGDLLTLNHRQIIAVILQNADGRVMVNDVAAAATAMAAAEAVAMAAMTTTMVAAAAVVAQQWRPRRHTMAAGTDTANNQLKAAAVGRRCRQR